MSDSQTIFRLPRLRPKSPRFYQAKPMNKNKENQLVKDVLSQEPLPRTVKSMMDANVGQSNALAVTTALFAGVMLTLAQIVASDNNVKSTAGWTTLQVFMYGSIISNITTAMLALLAVIFCTELPFQAHSRRLHMKDSWPSQVNLNSFPILFSHFGMSKFYKWVIWGQLAWLSLSIILTFLAMVTWIKLSQPILVFWTSLVISIMGFGGLAICLVGHLVINYFTTPGTDGDNGTLLGVAGGNTTASVA